MLVVEKEDLRVEAREHVCGGWTWRVFHYTEDGEARVIHKNLSVVGLPTYEQALEEGTNWAYDNGYHVAPF